MNVTELLHKLLMVANVEIEIPLLPEVRGVVDQSPRNALLQRLNGIRQSCAVWLTQQKMYMFRHHHISVNAKLEIAANALEPGFKCAF